MDQVTSQKIPALPRPKERTLLARPDLPGSGPHDVTAPGTFETADRLARATVARFTQGISPYAQGSALYDWAAHLARSPGRLTELWLEAVGSLARLGRFALGAAEQEAPEPPF